VSESCVRLCRRLSVRLCVITAEATTRPDRQYQPISIHTHEIKSQSSPCLGTGK
jgi:hypothetical protein